MQLRRTRKAEVKDTPRFEPEVQIITPPSNATTTRKGRASRPEKRRRNRKDATQMAFLMQEFRKDPTWSKDTCKRVAGEVGLTVSQVYKWGWD